MCRVFRVSMADGMARGQKKKEAILRPMERGMEDVRISFARVLAGILRDARLSVLRW